MDKKLSILNFALLFITGILIVWIVGIWTRPYYPLHIDGKSIVKTPKILKEFSANRKTYPESMVSQIMSRHLLRKERTEYRVQRATDKTKDGLPPPEFKVKGILLLKNIRMAVIEGHYYISGPDNKPEKKSIKKKGYELNEYIGDYEIVAIDKDLVTLRSVGGNAITRYLKHQSITPITHEANLLYYKKKKTPKTQPAPANTQPTKVAPIDRQVHRAGPSPS